MVDAVTTHEESREGETVDKVTADHQAQDQESSSHGNEKTTTLDPEKQLADSDRASTASHQNGHQLEQSKKVKEARAYNNRPPYHERHKRTTGSNDHRSNQQNEKKRENMNKFNPASLPQSDDPVAIRKQVEFYFSDSNLLTDKFLFNKIEGHQNNPVPIDIIHSFKRMHHFQPRNAIVSALKDSATLNIVNKDNDIQRKTPLPEGLVGKPIDEILKVHEDESMARSIYAKGFGKEEASTQFDIEAFFANYGTTNSVRLRRGGNKEFKGSVFVEFDNEETAKAFTATQPPVKYKGHELLVKTKKQYCDDKVEDIKAGRVRPHSPSPTSRKGKYGGDARGSRRDEEGHDDRDWRLRRQEDAEKGFPNRHRDHEKSRRGGGQQGRGRGGGRGGRRDDDHKGRSRNTSSGSNGASPSREHVEKSETTKPEQESANKEVDVSQQEAPAENPAAELNGASNKRTREHDDTAEEGPEAKKVDRGDD